MTQAAVSGRLLTLNEVAKQCQVSRRTIERLIVREELPTLKVGRSTRVDPQEFAEWLHAPRDEES
jgi:excisionase family DNA binding protein